MYFFCEFHMYFEVLFWGWLGMEGGVEKEREKKTFETYLHKNKEISLL